MPQEAIAQAQVLLSSMRAGFSRVEAYEVIAESVAALVVLLDGPQAGLILFATKAADELFGYMEGELPGKNIRELVPERLREAHDTHFMHYSQHPGTRAMGQTHMQIRGLHRDGHEFSLAIGLRARVVTGQRCGVAIIVPQVTAEAHVAPAT